MRIKYITNVRLPTSRAYGYAIMKMCSEFAKAGALVNLFVPERKNNENKQDPFDVYGLEKNFKINKVKGFDFLGKTSKFGKFFYWIDILSFLLMSKSQVALAFGDVLYTRDFITTLFFSKKYFMVLELHDISSASFVFRMALKRAKMFVVLNNNLKSDLVSMDVSPDRIFVSPSGVDINDFVVNESRTDLRVKLDLPQKDKIVLYTGQFYKWKGVDILAEAARILPDITFVFVGGAEPEYSLFRAKYKNLKNVIVREFQDRKVVVSYLFVSDVLVIPNSGISKISSRYTSPLKLFEYMTTRVPIVASDLSSLREILTEKECVFAKPDSPEDFARAIQEVFAQPKLVEELSLNAYVKVQQFTWDKRAKNILEVIQSWI